MSRFQTSTLLAGLLLAGVAAQSVGSFGGKCPSVIAPGSILVVIPMFEQIPVLIVCAASALLFWVWGFRLFDGQPSVPRRTTWLFGALVVLSIAGFAAGWKYGLQYEGTVFTVATAAISGVCIGGIALLLHRSRRSPSFASTLAAHWLLFAWALTYAFPFLGEMP